MGHSRPGVAAAQTVGKRPKSHREKAKKYQHSNDLFTFR
jgi:hypothetical protein